MPCYFHYLVVKIETIRIIQLFITFHEAQTADRQTDGKQMPSNRVPFEHFSVTSQPKKLKLKFDTNYTFKF